MSAVLPVTIVIPTHDRRPVLARTLDALSRQTCPDGTFEVVVAANACTDDTVTHVRALATPYPLRVLDLPSPGAGAARNAGADAARAPLLVFLDDDVEVLPEFVEAHRDAHAGSGPDEMRVAVGYLPSVLQPRRDLFAVALRGWWEAMFDRMREPGHRWSYTDLLSGNFSIGREAFQRAGGFDVRYRCHEDYELGYRLVRAGASFVFAERARGRHTDETRFERACQRKRDEGRADVQLATQYPELRAALPLARRTSLKQRAMRVLAFKAPAVGNGIAAVLGAMLPVLERIGARASWYRVLYAIFGYWYERGAADAVGHLASLRSLMAGTWTDDLRDPGIPLQLEDLEAAERALDATRPRAATLRVGDRSIGRLAYEPGCEPLAGRHLRPALARIWHRNYVEALLQQDLIPALAARAATSGFDPHAVPERHARPSLS